MRRRTHAFLWVASAALLAACTSEPDCDPEESCTLIEQILADDLRLGGAVVAEPLAEDEAYRAFAVDKLDSWTPNHELKWVQIEPEPYEYRFEEADRIVELAERNGIEIRGHNLFWGQRIRTPDHVNEIRDPEGLRSAMRLHLETVMGRYAGRIPRYDVVNEPFVYDTTERADSIYQEVLGPGWVAEAFEMAHAVDPDAELWLNMTGATRVEGKHAEQVALAAELVAAGVPIHGVGLQTHIEDGGWNAAEYRSFIADYGELGLEVAMTEIDYPAFGGVASDGETERVYDEIVGICALSRACVEVTFWSWNDGYANLDRLDPAATPGLVDRAGRPKPWVADLPLE